MAKGKYLRKPNKRKSIPKFNVPKHIRKRIKALLGAGIVLGSLSSSYILSSEAEAQEEFQEEISQDYKQKTEPETEPETDPIKTYSICIAKNNAKIKVNNQSISIDPNSFIIVLDNEALAYDEDGNILKGMISDKDFEEVYQLTEEQMSELNVYQVVSTSDVNVRYSPEITNENKISTVPSLDYVLGYTTKTPEYDEEWVETLSINNNEIYSGYIREDLIREVDTLDSIKNKPKENLQDLENFTMVDTSSANNIDLKLRNLPDAKNSNNIITKIPHGTVVKVTGETIKSDNKTWSYITYETPKGDRVQGWVASNYLNNESLVIDQDSKTNFLGSVTGIDISTISPKDLRNLLEKGIPNNVKTPSRNY